MDSRQTKAHKKSKDYFSGFIYCFLFSLCFRLDVVFFHSKFPHIVQWIVVCWWWWLHVYACVHFFSSSSSYFEISCDVGNTVAECRTQTPFVMAIHFLRQQVLILKSDKMKWKRNKIKTNNELKMKYKMKITQHITKLKEKRSWAAKEKNGAKEIW